jgi:large subunit ribosomal protein L23
MGLLNKITGTADKDAKKTKKVSKKETDVLDMVKEETKSDKKAAVLKEDTGRAHSILRRYHLSEKSNILSTGGRYVFVVSSKANKIEVKKAVEAVYDVHVVKVNISNTKGKSRAYGRTAGRTSDWKKAVVTLKAGEKISGLAEGV